MWERYWCHLRLRINSRWSCVIWTTNLLGMVGRIQCQRQYVALVFLVDSGRQPRCHTLNALATTTWFAKSNNLQTLSAQILDMVKWNLPPQLWQLLSRIYTTHWQPPRWQPGSVFHGQGTEMPAHPSSDPSRESPGLSYWLLGLATGNSYGIRQFILRFGMCQHGHYRRDSSACHTVFAISTNTQWINVIQPRST